MKVARLIAKDRGKLPNSATPRVDALPAPSKESSDVNKKKCCGECGGGNASASTSKEEPWSCGVCYEEVCCPFSLPCGHTVCGDCLQQLLGRQARCPFCRISVFRGCTFGRNVAMWNAIHARHPAEACQLAESSAVITYYPTSPVRPASRHQEDSDHVHQESTESIVDPPRLQPSPAPTQRTVDAPPTTLISRVGLGLLAPFRMDLASLAMPASSTAFSHEAASFAQISHGTAASTANGPLHSSPSRVAITADTRFGASSADPPITYLINPTATLIQSGVLRRAQAPFADLRLIDAAEARMVMQPNL